MYYFNQRRFVIFLGCFLFVCFSSVSLLWAAKKSSTFEVVGFVFNKTENMRVQWKKKQLMVQIQPHAGEGKQAFAKRVMQNWRKDFKRISAFRTKKPLQRGRFIRFPFRVLKVPLQGASLRAIFSNDASTVEGWEHRVMYSWESMSLISGVFAQNQVSSRQLSAYNQVNKKNSVLRKGDRILIPWKWLRSKLELMPMSVQKPLVLQKDRNGKRYATYRIKKGETLYSSVVSRFTGRLLHEDVDRMAKKLLKINQISDAHLIRENQVVRIPLEWLSEEYLNARESLVITPRIAVASVAPKKRLPEKSKASKKQKSKVSRERKKSSAPQIAQRPVKRRRSRNTNKSVHIILDAGHGGIDPGAVAGSKKRGDRVYEDEVVYDIALRMNGLLKDQKYVVHSTLIDPNQRKPISWLNKKSDRDEYLNVTPPYLIRNVRVSVNMRIYLVNSIYRKLRRQGVDKDNIIFMSLHGDALHPSLRGAMIYYPDHRLRRGSFGLYKSVYLKRKEYISGIRFGNIKENKYAEQSSKSFGKTIIESFRQAGVPTHKSSSVRGYLYRWGKRSLPGIIRYSKIPTSVLVEVANLNNSRDRHNMLRYQVRQKVAKALVHAVNRHFRKKSSLIANR